VYVRGNDVGDVIVIQLVGISVAAPPHGLPVFTVVTLPVATGSVPLPCLETFALTLKELPAVADWNPEAGKRTMLN
jgi:hypothetical protein